jgi:DNA excision repair protein ERCC-5
MRAEQEAQRQAAKSAREDAGVSAEMIEEVIFLLELFGVPYIWAPMEAEAQCAALEAGGVVDGHK